MLTPALSILGVLLPFAHRVHFSLSDLVHVCAGYLSSFPFCPVLLAPLIVKRS